MTGIFNDLCLEDVSLVWIVVLLVIMRSIRKSSHWDFWLCLKYHYYCICALCLVLKKDLWTTLDEHTHEQLLMNIHRKKKLSGTTSVIRRWTHAKMAFDLPTLPSHSWTMSFRRIEKRTMMCRVTWLRRCWKLQVFRVFMSPASTSRAES